MTPQEFIDRWKGSGGAELANSQSFLKELCTLLDVPHPEPTQADESRNTYVFEKAVAFNNGDGTTSAGRVDLYRRGSFVLESKQGVERKEAEQAEVLATVNRQRKLRSGTAQRGTPGWEQAMVRARQQAKRYAEALPDEWPPLLIVADVGHCFDLYADFTQSGKNYVPFPDPQTYRIRLQDLADEQVRDKLRAIWLDPASLDPSRRAAKVTREVAQRLARLAKSMEGKHTPKLVAEFLMRCLFTMFAEDVQLGGLRRGDFTRFLQARRGKLHTFVPMLEQLWKEMDTGGFSVILEAQLKQFNGGLFQDHTAVPVTEDQLELLIEAAEAQWSDVEPAIFGTLLERALDPVERHKLGAHYTPRAYVERLVMPTIIEPLRDQWDTVYATAVALYEDGKAAEAIKAVRRFHEQLCETRVLDPACGSGNFLYVSLELMKRLEGEVLKALRDFGDRQQVLLTIDPHQFLGIEVNPRAAAITDLVLWIGYLQWHFRTRGDQELREPIIRNFHNIECRDAVLAWDRVEPVVDDQGKPVTRWDGRTTKPHPVTGEEVPDETARVQELRYINPRKAEWPKADYVVGNPPFVGNKRMRAALGSGYVDALRLVYDHLPHSIDFVMYWWSQAAEFTGRGQINAMGLVTTNSIVQSFNRAVLDLQLASPEYDIHFPFAIADHPWVDTADGANVRIAMTVTRKGKGTGTLYKSVDDSAELRDPRIGTISGSLSVGADVASSRRLTANVGLTFQGIIPVGDGFRLSKVQVHDLGFDTANLPREIKPYIIGRDLTQHPQQRWIIDFSGLDEDAARAAQPKLYQWIYDRVRPERLQKRDKKQREKWWLFTRTRDELRDAVAGLSRFIVTPYTAKHRPFTFIESPTLPDAMVYTVATADAFVLGVLSSRAHRLWDLNAGGKLEDRPRYNNTVCFEPFPFPSCDASLRERIGKLGEQLDAHRKRQQALHPDLTMTGMYNVLERLRAADKVGQASSLPSPSSQAGSLRHDADSGLGDARDDHKDAPDDRGNAPDDRGNAPDDRGNTPDDRGNAPNDRGNTPDDRGNTPDERGNTPDERGNTPDERGNTPDDRGNTPDERGNTPDERGTAGDEAGKAWDDDGRAPGNREKAQDVREDGLSIEKSLEKRLREADQRGAAISLTTKERQIHEKGLVSVLKQIHDELDATVFDAYGWPHDLNDEEILQRLVDLNHERAAEEARGLIRWLRPEFQNPAGAKPTQQQFEPDEEEVQPVAAAAAKPKKQAWPASLPERFTAVRSALAEHRGPAAAAEVNDYFKGGRNRGEAVEEILDTLVAVGQIRQTDDGRYVA